ncbi:UDP-glucosyltransferase 2-like [Battus philenor]|uniref:UDP-glucosyltransferase 2-like n=1 Tax=Battus philenor TaxID=42288 RepID=UPI0035CF6C7B
MIIKICLCIILLTSSYLCEGYKILLMSPFPAKSHFILGNGLIKHLTKAGHEITFVTAHPKEKVHPLVRVVDVSENYAAIPKNLLNLKAVMDNKIDLGDSVTFFNLMVELNRMTLENPNMQKILNDPNERFDLIIGEWMYNDLYAGLPAIFQCPYIWFSTLEPHWMVMRVIDEITNPAYVPDSMSRNVPPFTFLQRVQELGIQISGMALDLYYTSIETKEYDRIIAPIARSRNNIVPTFEELKYNISLVLGNSHVSMGQPVRLPQSYKAIGGFHIDEEVKPLPQDLKALMDNAENGVIYFSMGSNLKSKELPTEIKEGLLKMFGELKQTVLWKFEEDLPGAPKNVHILKWAPQQSILAHPKCVLFITHGGLLSTTETIHFGVPIIGIPVFGDQFINVDVAVHKGFAKQVKLSYSVVEDLKLAIHDILSDPKYTARVKELSFIYHHRPTSPGQELVHWVEHVVITAGAPHLRSPALLVSWYQKIYLDLLALVLTVFSLAVYIIRHLLRNIARRNPDKNKKRN